MFTAACLLVGVIIVGAVIFKVIKTMLPAIITVVVLFAIACTFFLSTDQADKFKKDLFGKGREIVKEATPIVAKEAGKTGTILKKGAREAFKHANKAPEK